MRIKDFANYVNSGLTEQGHFKIQEDFEVANQATLYYSGKNFEYLCDGLASAANCKVVSITDEDVELETADGDSIFLTCKLFDDTIIYIEGVFIPRRSNIAA